MSDYKSKLNELKFHNWIKTGLALMYTKEGLHHTVEDEIETFQRKTVADILASQNMHVNTMCKNCSTEQIVCYRSNKMCKQKKCSELHKPCPENGLCEYFRDKIIQAHRFGDPSWKNTDAQLWYTDPWQIAKCFMPKEGYSFQKTAQETDFNGVISVILNYRGFQNKVKENLGGKNNIFCKARQISRDFRHSAIFEVSDDTFEEYTQILKKVLTNSKNTDKSEAATEALQKIEKLSTDSWSLTSATEDVKSLFNEEMHFEEDEAFEKAKENRTERRRMLREATENVSNKLDEIEAAIRLMRRSSIHFGQAMRQDLVDQLITAYEDQCSTLPISALLEEEDAQLLEFFAKPIMRQTDHHKIKRACATVRSYKDIFFKKGQPCRNIYVTGDAGIGKTAVCQRMVLAWCHAKSGRKADHNFSQEDIDIMKTFDFLFYVSLRETKLCHVAEMIQQQMQASEKADLIAQILENEKCLIILDGLDEWTHQTSNSLCPLNRKFPHRQPSDNCTYLTTSRPWKLEGDRLKTNEIDQQIELRGLDKHACNQLSTSVVEHLNATFEESRKPNDFQNEIARNKLDKVCVVPIVMMQLICLWFDEMTLCISRCSIYGQTLEMLFKRATERHKHLSNDVVSHSQTQETTLKSQEMDCKLPGCFNLLQTASTHAALLYKLGNMAFDSLFGSEDGESELVFESSRGKLYDISESEMEFLLSVGILSKNKAVGTLSKRKLKLSFLHRSYQEFLAAVFIAMQEGNADETANKIFSTCETLELFLRYENMFIFLAGMCPELLNKFSDKIKGLLFSDKQVCQYRRFSDYKFGFIVMLPPFSILTDKKFTEVRNADGLLNSYQTLALQCQEECQRSGSGKVELPLEDIFISDTCSPQLQALLISNTNTLKSVATETFHDDLLLVKSLEKISISFHGESESFGEGIEKYEKCIRPSGHTLTCISVSNYRGIFDFCALEFPSLKSIDLFNLVLEHKEITGMFSFISNKTDLIQILLFQIRCSEHGAECMGGKLDLSRHRELNFLRLHHVYEYGQHEIKLNCTDLGTLIFEDSLKASQKTSSLLGDIRNAPRLFEVTLLGLKSRDTLNVLSSVIRTLKHLKRLSLYNCDFGEKYIQFDAEKQREIEIICIVNSTMAISSFCAFVDSIPYTTNKGVTVHMQSCRVSTGDEQTTPQEEAETAKDYVVSKNRFSVMKSTPFQLQFDTFNRQKYC